VTVELFEGMVQMKFTIIEKDGSTKKLDFMPVHIINAGYTGRNQAAVQAHIDELRAEGIPAPDKIPTYFAKFVEKMTQSEFFEVLDENDHSGEAEFVVLIDKNAFYIGVGSDHTDRKLEMIDIPKAKQVYPNTIGKDVWRLKDVADHWDKIVLRSWIKANSVKTLFQEAELNVMLDANDLIKRVKGLLTQPSNINGLVIYSGTVAALFKADYSSYFEVELEDPILGRKISNKYNMTCISEWFRGDR
jgi:hypothetical protein